MGIDSISPAGGGGFQGGMPTPREEHTAVHAAPVEKAAVPTHAQRDHEARNGQDFSTDEKNQENQISDTSVKNAVEEINKSSQSTEAIYGYHEGMHRYTIKIVDKDTKEVVKEYPSEERLDMIQKVLEKAGLIVDEKR